MLLFLLFSCQEPNVEITYNYERKPKGSETNDTNGSPTDSAQEPTNEELTFYGDIRPILDRTCNQCHWEAGRSFQMLDPTFVTAWAPVIHRDIEDGGKPPPTPDPECANYLGDYWHITDQDISTIQKWIDQDCPVGDEAEAPTYSDWDSIGPFDQELDPEFSITTTEGYRCFVYMPEENKTITAMQFSTSDEELIHHSLVYLTDEDYTRPETSREDLDCSYSGQEDWKLIAGWRPGAPPIPFSEGQGIPVKPGQKLILQMYYTPPIGQYPEDLDLNPDYKWGIKYAESTPQSLYPKRIANFDIMIPADATNHQEKAEYVWNEGKAQLVGILPRTHLYGIGIEAEVQKANDVTQCLFHVSGYDFGMPHMLLFSDVIEIENGDVIKYNCSWDNSEGNDRQMRFPPMDIFPGYGIEDAVCYLDFLVLPLE